MDGDWDNLVSRHPSLLPPAEKHILPRQPLPDTDIIRVLT